MTTIATEPRESTVNGATGTPAPGRRRNPIPLLILGSLVLGGAGWAVHRYRFAATHESTDNAQVDGHITAIAPRVQAFVDRVLVDDNQRVRPGDTLVVLDARTLRARLEQAQAEYRAAVAASGRGSLSPANTRPNSRLVSRASSRRWCVTARADPTVIAPRTRASPSTA